MARFILETAGEDITVGGSDVDVIGTNAGGEEITVTGGNITLDGSFTNGGDTIALVGEAEDYTATISGSRVILTSTVNGTTISIPVGTAGLAIEFGGDDTRTLRVNAGGALVLGDQVIAATGETTLESGDDDLTVVEALAVLQAAEVALSDFETEQGATGDDLRANLDTAEATLAAERGVITDAQLEANLISANADVDAAETDVEAVPGLAAAIEERDETFAEAIAAFEASEAADEEEAAAVAAYNARTGADIDVNSLNLAVDGVWSGTVEAGGTTLIEVVAGEPRLAAGVTEATNPGITDVFNTIVAAEEADVAEIEAADAYFEAVEAVTLLDQVPSADDERAAVAELATAVSAYNSALNAYEANQTAATASALETAYDGIVAEGVADVVTANGDNPNVAADILANAGDIDAAVEVRQTNLEAALVAAENDNPLTDIYDDAVDAQEIAQAEVDARDALIENVADAQDLVNEVEELEADVTEAQDNIVDMGYTLPMTVQGATEIATAGNDIFVFAEEDGSIDNFGAAGDDILFIGTDYTVVELAAGVDLETSNRGSVSTLEVFIQQDGDDTVLYFEDTTFAGSATNGFTGYTVVLEDVDADTVSFDATGYITVGDTTFA
jgi:hypothetical protein